MSQLPSGTGRAGTAGSPGREDWPSPKVQPALSIQAVALKPLGGRFLQPFFIQHRAQPPENGVEDFIILAIRTIEVCSVGINDRVVFQLHIGVGPIDMNGYLMINPGLIRRERPLENGLDLAVKNRVRLVTGCNYDLRGI